MRTRYVVLTALLAIAAALLLARLPVTHAAPPKPSPARPGDSGSLQVLGKDGQVVALCPLRHTEVKAEISGFLARVEVTQEFVNPTSERIEAVYVFPLPQNAAVNDMTMRVGGRLVRGLIKRREEAAALYDQARRTGHTAALLDQERPNIFTQSVANILPGEQVTITITYVDTLKYEAGSYEFLFPTVVGPRYIPGSALPAGQVGGQGGGRLPDTDRVPDASRITPPVAPEGVRAGHDISIQVTLDAGVPITDLRSELHQIDVERTGASSAIVRLRDLDTIPNKDFILRYDVAGAEVADALLVHAKPPRGATALGGALGSPATAGYFTFILQPPERVFDDDATPRELVFVLDTSGSMSGFPIEKAKETMALALANLRKNDTFNLITFAGDTHILFDQPVPATPENLALAQKFLASRSGGGGTEMMKAIRAALAPSSTGDAGPDHVRIVCFMTDGYVGNDMEIIGAVKKYSNARVFSFGIGSSVNRFLLDNMAREGRGEVEYVTLESDGAAAVARFEERVRTPLLTDVSLDWNGLPVADVSPARPADLFSAKPLIITGRYTHAARGTVTLRGRRAGQPFTRDLAVDLPAQEDSNRVLATLWARRQVDDLMARDWKGAQQGSMSKDLVAQVTQLGLDYRLLTQFTSFVAVEEMVVTENGAPRTVQVPVEIPLGVDRAMAVGEEKDVALRAPAAGWASSAKLAPSPAPPPCMTCATTNYAVVEVNAGRVDVNTSDAQISSSVSGKQAPDGNAAALAGQATGSSGLEAMQRVGQAPGGAGFGGPNPRGENEKSRRALEQRTRLEQSYGGKTTGELLALLICADNKQPEAAAKCFPEALRTMRVRITLADASPAVLDRLKQLGFRLTLQPSTAKLVYGELPAASLRAVLDLKEVLFVTRAEPFGAAQH